MSDARDVLARVHDLPVDTVAVGVTDADDTLACEGALDDVLPLASVTKPLTAYATLIAVQDGAIHLDEPVSIDGVSADVTVRQLLAHASGLSVENDGAPVSEPERRRVYSNWGYELLGDLVADRVGLSFADHLDLDLLRPLGMRSTVLEGSPAHAASGTVRDLLAFLRELLDPQLLGPTLHRQATTIAFPGLDGVLPGYGRQDPNDWTLGFELRGTKSPHWAGERLPASTFGHFGRSGSLIWVDPEHHIACAFLGDRDFGRWAAEAWPYMNDAIVDTFGER